MFADTHTPCAYTWRPEEDVRYPTHSSTLSLPYSLETESLTEPELAIFQQNWAARSGGPHVPSASVRGLEVHAATTSFYVDVGNPDSCPCLYSKCSYPFTQLPSFYCFKQLIKGAEAMA